jgi:hypothetical protein
LIGAWSPRASAKGLEAWSEVEDGPDGLVGNKRKKLSTAGRDFAVWGAAGAVGGGVLN